MKINIHSIHPHSFVDGPGDRTVLFVQGCTIGCPGCQNRLLWPATGGVTEEVDDVARTLALLSCQTGNVTISGGESLQQPAAITELVFRLRSYGIGHLILYTGYTWEQLLNPVHPAYPYLKDLLPMLDILVDGPFIRSADDDFVAWRGSRNQRPIDVPASLEAGVPVVIDWDLPITLTPEGDLVLPAGLSGEFSTLGASAPSPMCGQLRR